MAQLNTNCNCYYWTLKFHQCKPLDGTPVYGHGEIIVTRPDTGGVPSGDFLVPALVFGSTDGGLRLDLQFASGRTANVGIGNIRKALDWQVAGFYRMAEVSA